MNKAEQEGMNSSILARMKKEIKLMKASYKKQMISGMISQLVENLKRCKTKKI